MKTYARILWAVAITALLGTGTSCKKMLDLRPENLTLSEEALKTPEDIQALLILVTMNLPT